MTKTFSTSKLFRFYALGIGAGLCDWQENSAMVLVVAGFYALGIGLGFAIRRSKSSNTPAISSATTAS